jgi:hypothetical protein
MQIVEVKYGRSVRRIATYLPYLQVLKVLAAIGVEGCPWLKLAGRLDGYHVADEPGIVVSCGTQIAGHGTDTVRLRWEDGPDEYYRLDELATIFGKAEPEPETCARCGTDLIASGCPHCCGIPDCECCS